MIDFDFDKKCYGCTACVSVCPTKAISMRENEEGFQMPVIDHAQCSNCHLCENVCPHLLALKEPKTIDKKNTYSFFLKDEEKLLKSSSGGAAYALARVILDDVGWVCGCVWNEKMEAEHIVSDRLDDVERMCGSKYVQSNLKDCFPRIKTLLRDGKKVLFIGSDCQVAGLKNYLRHDDDNLITCSFICHGVPSPLVWRQYKNDLEKKVKASLTSVNFKSAEEIGWNSPYCVYTFLNCKSLREPSSLDSYVLGFVSQNLYLRNACSVCQYKGTRSISDIIIGDFWGCGKILMQQSHNKGVSCILCSDKSNWLVDKIKVLGNLNVTTRSTIAQANKLMDSSTHVNEQNRVKFYSAFKKRKCFYEAYHFFRESYSTKLKKILFKLHVFAFTKRLINAFKVRQW